MDPTQLTKIVNGALKNAIDSHGPITKENYGSASKRIVAQIQGFLKEKQKPLDNDEIWATLTRSS